MNKRFYSFVDRVAFHFDQKGRKAKANARCAKKLSSPLSCGEKKIFDAKWGCDGWSPASYELYKAYGCPFDADIVPNDFYDYAEHVLNLRWGAFFLQHKCNLKFIVPAVNRPVTILEKIDGHYVTEDNVEMSEMQARQSLSEKDAFICKIALGSGGGRGITKVHKGDGTDFDKLLKPADLIFQEVIQQNKFMSQFNPDSVNTFRILTLNINGRCTVLSAFLRMGAKGSFVDNLCSGGGVLVGVNRSGELNAYGISKGYDKIYSSSTGLRFAGIVIPGWDAIKERIIGFHKLIPYANLIGWDVTLGRDGEPIVIEINLDHAEIEAHQLFNGPVFGERLQEVRDYISDKKPKIRHAMVTY